MIMTAAHVIESMFEHCGLPCVVVMRMPGYRCGYVGVPRGHCLYGVEYQDYLEIKKADLGDREVDNPIALFSACIDDDPRIRADAYFRCHGGLTYSDGGDGSEYPIDNDCWWFGFDCSHAGDTNDYATAKRLFAEDPDKLQRIERLERLDMEYFNPDDEVRTLQYTENECRKLAEQLADFPAVLNPAKKRAPLYCSKDTSFITIRCILCGEERLMHSVPDPYDCICPACRELWQDLRRKYYTEKYAKKKGVSL